MEMEPIVSSETSAIRTQTPGNYPKRNNLHLEHGENLRTRSEIKLKNYDFKLVSYSSNIDVSYLCIIAINYYYYYMHFIVKTHSALCLLLSYDKFYIHFGGSLEYWIILIWISSLLVRLLAKQQSGYSGIVV